jgi:hypothetical protein
MSLKLLIEEYECITCKKAYEEIKDHKRIYYEGFVNWFYKHYEKMKNKDKNK